MTLRKFILERIREREGRADAIRKAGYEGRLGGQFADHLPTLQRLDTEVRVLRNVLIDYERAK